MVGGCPCIPIGILLLAPTLYYNGPRQQILPLPLPFPFPFPFRPFPFPFPYYYKGKGRVGAPMREQFYGADPLGPGPFRI
jgi:hypothetical protein